MSFQPSPSLNSLKPLFPVLQILFPKQKALIFFQSPLIITQGSLPMLQISPLHPQPVLEIPATTNTNIKEGHQREDTVTSSSLDDLLDAKSVVRKVITQQIVIADISKLMRTNISNLMPILLKPLLIAPFMMHLQIGTQIRVHQHT